MKSPITAGLGKSLLLTWLGVSAWVCAAQVQPLAGTAPLTMQGDIASNLLVGVDRFLSRKIDESVAGRAQFWHRDFSSAQAYEQSLATNRQRLGYILGLNDPRISQVDLELIATPTRQALCGRGQDYEVYAVRWPAFGDVTGEGLLLTPVNGAPVANVVAIPDADQTPEQLAGLTEGIAPESQFARRLAESGCRVLVPVLISRHIDPQAKLSNREFIYRPAYELGRHVIGYEIQKVLAGIDWMTAQSSNSAVKTGVIGWGEGGLLAFYAAALDPRITAGCVSGYFDDRRKIWQQPIDRNVFGLLEEFGDAEVAAMIAPRSLIIEAARGPEVTMPGGNAYTASQLGNGAPGILVSSRLEDVRSEFERARALVAGLQPAPRLELVVSGGTGAGPFGSEGALSAFLTALASPARLAAQGPAPENLWPGFDPAARQAAQVHELDRHNQRLLAESPYVRQKFMTNLDTTSPEKFRQSAEGYRDFFYRQVIGRFDDPVLPANPRSRVIYDEPKWTGYEVMLGVFPDVGAYGILLVPKDLKPGERRPVVVCQHGLEGRPRSTVMGGTRAHYGFAGNLCEQGFITFSPQEIFIFGDRFRAQQREANPLGKTLFSIIVPQQQQITDWLKTQPFVDPARIGFYGISYGGKTAMRVPALVTNYCLSICSADFNDWVWKCASTLSPYSYVRSPEYDMYEFNLGSTFSYAEIAALIAPRPFMVERGHFDVVAPDETVAYEFAKVRFLYEARLGLRDQCAIEWFTGPHSIHGVGTFDFLHRHLDWPVPGASSQNHAP
ncbi:MAG: dienelactone hydrolase family protein [Verrucomicrobiota bacterium]|jgi:dienelactone hydrolase